MVCLFVLDWELSQTNLFDWEVCVKETFFQHENSRRFLCRLLGPGVDFPQQSRATRRNVLVDLNQIYNLIFFDGAFRRSRSNLNNNLHFSNIAILYATTLLQYSLIHWYHTCIDTIDINQNAKNIWERKTQVWPVRHDFFVSGQPKNTFENP